jgi:GDP-4-dehydro-6-deoxy-D-mannose reductase
MKILVTGADGFVGRHLVPRLVETGHTVSAGCRPAGEPLERWLPADYRKAVQVVPVELNEPAMVQTALRVSYDAIVHLAAVASGNEARQDPARAWIVNAAGTARLLQAAGELRKSGQADPIVLVVSSAEVYGSGPATPRVESDPLYPQSAYAASKVGAEIAALEAWRRTGIRIVIARPFPHTGRGQSPQYAVPAFVQRLLAAKAEGRTRVPTGNLDPVRDLLDVRDVVEAYIGLLANGAPGETYNISRGEGISLRALFDRIAALVGLQAEPVSDPSLIRAGDIPYLVGDSTKLRRTTGWCPTIAVDQTLGELLDAQAH